MDADMMDSESPAPPAVAPPSSSNSGQSEVIRGLLILARQLIDQGNPSQALQAVVMAARTKGGDVAVVESLQRARELYKDKLQARSDADELASLFAECAIAEAADTSQPSPSQSDNARAMSDQQAIENGTSILSEAGRKQVMLDAFSDGSSFVCLQCGGLVSNHRKDEHYAFWCGNI